MTAAPEWAATNERGSSTLLAVVVWCIRKLGTGPIRLLVVPVALYYTVFDGRARRASRRYLIRVGLCDENAGFLDRLVHTYRHFRSFAEMILDRLILWGGDPDEIGVTIRGPENVLDLLAQQRGAFMVGAHLGNFDVLRIIAREADIPVNALMYTANAEQINSAFEMLDPTARVRILDVTPGSVASANITLNIRQRIAEGEFVASTVDRFHPGDGSQEVEVDFLGERARFPKGVFRLAMILRAPVLLTVALRTGPGRYEIFFETLSDGSSEIDRNERRKVLDEQVQHFAARLEHYCRRAPYQWFNFYDFWHRGER